MDKSTPVLLSKWNTICLKECNSITAANRKGRNKRMTKRRKSRNINTDWEWREDVRKGTQRRREIDKEGWKEGMKKGEKDEDEKYEGEKEARKERMVFPKALLGTWTVGFPQISSLFITYREIKFCCFPSFSKETNSYPRNKNN